MEGNTHCTFFCQADWRSFDFVFCWLYFLFTIGGGNFSGKWCWQWLDDSDDRDNDWLCSFRWLLIVAMIKRWLFQFNRRLQADPNLPHLAKLADDLILWLRRWWCFNIPYVSKNLKRETAIMAKLNHPIVVSVQEVVSVGSFYCLVLDFFPWWRRRDWEREESFELLEEISRWFFNYDHHFFDGDGNDQISMKMIVRTKKAFDLNYVQKRKSNVCSGGRLCSSILDSCPICGLQCSRFLSNPVTMMGMLDYNSHNDGEIVDDDDDNALISLRWSQYQNSYLDITIWCSL